MRFFAALPWKRVGMIAAAWAATWLLIQVLVIWLDFRAIMYSSQSSGGLAAAGYGMSWLGALVTFGVPILLLALRLLAPRFHSDEPLSNER